MAFIGRVRESVSLLVDIAKLKDYQKDTMELGLRREFVSCLNKLNLYHMHFALPLRIDEYNNLLNKYSKQLTNRDNVVIVENIAPVSMYTTPDE